MKTIKQIKLLTLLVTICVLFCAIPVSAISAYIPIDNYTYVESLINALTSNKFTIIDSMVLNQLGGDSSYTLYALSPQGYAIYNNTEAKIEELSIYSSEIPYLLGSSNNYYYGGPECYYVEKNGSYIDLSTGTILTEDMKSKVIERMRSVKVQRDLQVNSISQYTITPRAGIVGEDYYAYKEYFESLGNNFGVNTEDTNSCTHIACAILIGFYDDIIDPNYITNNQYKGSDIYGNPIGTNEVFHQLLRDNNYIGSSSANVQEAAAGLENYFEDYGPEGTIASYMRTNYQTVYNRVCVSIENGRPVVASLFKSTENTAPYNHSVVVYGRSVVRIGGNIDSIYYTAHTGRMYYAHIKTYAYEWFRDVLWIT